MITELKEMNGLPVFGVEAHVLAGIFELEGKFYVILEEGTLACPFMHPDNSISVWMCVTLKTDSKEMFCVSGADSSGFRRNPWGLFVCSHSIGNSTQFHVFLHQPEALLINFTCFAQFTWLFANKFEVSEQFLW